MSTKKEKVEFVRTDEFEAVEDELGAAMEALEQSNARIAELLNSENRDSTALAESVSEAAPGIAPVSPIPEGAGRSSRVRRAKAKPETPA